jgi:hypothetical protein
MAEFLLRLSSLIGADLAHLGCFGHPHGRYHMAVLFLDQLLGCHRLVLDPRYSVPAI